ncbi:hypothetical protein RN001_002516 [Aquatica leii]|uniref:Sodium channel and clathrin linker 1 n=1 Tax=Aquatica leii TaxID=1421715 RepID=A0AAN7SSU9_9COLE|nr:hypothetical protein RN001_002516 [Aquatica leii]
MENYKPDLLAIIREYESAVEMLTAQIDFYAHEQEHLRKEISNLMIENKNLSEALREVIESRPPLPIGDDQNLQNNLADNLKKQLLLTLQEKDTVVELWQNSLKNIDHLEEELIVFSDKSNGFISKKQVQQIKINYENQIKNLEQQLANMHTKIQTVLKTSSKTIEDKNFDLENAFRCQKHAITQMRTLENEIKDLQINITDIIKIRDKLEVTLKHKNKMNDELKEQMTQSKKKVEEAVQVVEAAFREKDAAILRENIAKEEIIKISKILSNVLDETSDKMKNDIKIIKEECDTKIKQTNIKADTLREELNHKNAELQKSIYEYKLLQNEFEKLSSEKNVIKIEAEKERMRVELHQLTSSHHNDIKKFQTENESLKEELKSIKKKLKKCQKNLVQATEAATNLKFTIRKIEKDDKQVESQLQSYLDKEIGLNKKWKRGMQDVVHKYETQIKNLKNTNQSLRHKLKRMLKEVLFRSNSKNEAQTKINSKIKLNSDDKSVNTD